MVEIGRLDAALDEADRLFAGSEDEARAFLETFCLAPPAPPRDPFSDAYRRWTWDLYRTVSGRDAYSVESEESPFDVQAALSRPFPYATGSAAVVSRDLLSRGHLLATLGRAGVGPPARVVELGPGWGNLTADLAMTGYRVTAVEVGDRFASLLRQRCPAVEVVHADMLTFARRPPAERFDAAVFYESFHHCADHLELLRSLHGVVGVGGVVALCAEPVDLLPYPWGPRLDGLSLWSSRRYGWLELGFDERYLAEALRRTGWVASQHPGPIPAATVHLLHAAVG